MKQCKKTMVPCYSAALAEQHAFFVMRFCLMPKKQSGFTLIELMIVVAILSILVAVTFPAYQVYVKRTRVANALTLAAGAQFAVAESTTINHALPSTQVETGYVSPSVTDALQSIVIANDGTAVITLTFTAALGGGTMVLRPTLDATGTLTWNCQGGSLPAQYRPTICRP